MRGFGFLVVFSVVACSGSVTDPSETEMPPVVQAGASGQVSSAGGPSDVAGAAGKPPLTGLAGSPSETVAGAGGSALTHPSAGGSSAGATAQGGAGGKPGSAGAAGSAAAGSPADGSSSAGTGGVEENACAGFTTYTVDVGSCISVSGDYQQQTDPSCSASTIVLRDHCSTCASWTAVAKPLIVMLATTPEAAVKHYDAPSGVCPSSCKYICD